ncbi:MAG: pyridoxamine 5'-phosphate oxidase family protein [Armatimonadetes bacterium]|nr:pyridoxamine 5'-phosphate oxidase family protein [Armatimonadota bacterium]
MIREEIIAMARRVVSEGKPFVLATVDADGGPRMRWMGGLVLEDPLTIYMACGASSRKMDQIRGNPRGQLMFQTEGFREVVTLYGTCHIVDDAKVKEKLWAEMPVLENYFAGADDPNFGVIRFETQRVEIMIADRHDEPPLVADV